MKQTSDSHFWAANLKPLETPVHIHVPPQIYTS